MENITVKRKDNHLKFYNLDIGDVFVTEKNNDEVFIKIQECEVEGWNRNAISLVSGEFFLISNGVGVTKIKKMELEVEE